MCIHTKGCQASTHTFLLSVVYTRFFHIVDSDSDDDDMGHNQLQQEIEMFRNPRKKYGKLSINNMYARVCVLDLSYLG